MLSLSWVLPWISQNAKDAGKDCGQEEKGATQDEVVGWHYRLNGHAFEQVWEIVKDRGAHCACSPWGHKESDTTD